MTTQTESVVGSKEELYPPKKIVSSKVRAFVDFYVEAIGEPPYWDDGLALVLKP